MPALFLTGKNIGVITESRRAQRETSGRPTEGDGGREGGTQRGRILKCNVPLFFQKTSLPSIFKRGRPQTNRKERDARPQSAAAEGGKREGTETGGGRGEGETGESE